MPSLTQNPTVMAAVGVCNDPGDRIFHACSQNGTLKQNIIAACGGNLF